jgi:hypothetical protein
MPSRSASLFDPVDNAGLVAFRILFGALMVCECGGALATGWVTRALVEPRVRFPMIGFEWVPLPDGPGYYLYYAAMAVLAAMVAVGAFCRASLAGFTILWAGAYVAQTAHYNNHYYLIVLLSGLLWTTPAAADVSLDAHRDPRRRHSTCPRWCYTVFIAQTAILYGYAAYAKLQPDWLAGRPVELWLETLERIRPVGWIYAQPGLKWVVAWGGLAFDALVVPALLYRRTRPLAVVAAVVFHLFNSLTFRVGVFPYLGLALLVFFIPPRRIRALLPSSTATTTPVASAGEGSPASRIAGMTAFATYFALQLVLPLRHHLYPGNVDWHEEGYTMSWRMMLRAKAGRARFIVRDPATGTQWEVDPSSSLSRHQAAKLPVRPDMIWQFAQELKREYAGRGLGDVEVFADVRARLNGRPQAPLVDPRVDLASVQWRFLAFNDWITPEPRSDAARRRSRQPADPTAAHAKNPPFPAE